MHAMPAITTAGGASREGADDEAAEPLAEVAADGVPGLYLLLALVAGDLVGGGDALGEGGFAGSDHPEPAVGYPGAGGGQPGCFTGGGGVRPLR